MGNSNTIPMNFFADPCGERGAEAKVEVPEKSVEEAEEEAEEEDWRIVTEKVSGKNFFNT